MLLDNLKYTGQSPRKKNYLAQSIQMLRLRNTGYRTCLGFSRNLSLHGPAVSRAGLKAFISPDLET